MSTSNSSWDRHKRMTHGNGSVESLTLLHLARALDRAAAQEELIRKLFDRLERERILLNSALHDLAKNVDHPGKSDAGYIADWYRKRGGKV